VHHTRNLHPPAGRGKVCIAPARLDAEDRLQHQEFDERTGDAIALLDAYCLLDAFRDMLAKRETEALTARKPRGGLPPDDDEG